MPGTTTAPAPDLALVCVGINRRRAGRQWQALDNRLVAAAETVLGLGPDMALVRVDGRGVVVPAWLLGRLREALGDDAQFLVVTPWGP